MWRRKHNLCWRAVSAACSSSHHAPGASRSSLRPSVRLACLPHMPRWAHRPIRSPLALPCSSHQLPTGFAACLIRSPFLIVLSVCPLPRIAWLPAVSTSGAGRNHNRRRASRRAIGRRANGGGSSFGWRADSGGCLLASGRWTERFDRSLIVSFPISSAQSNRLRFPVRLISISHHLIDGNGFSFSFPPDPLPPALLCLLAGACSPVPGRGMCGLRHGLRWRAAGCLLAFLVPRSALSLPLVRLLLYAPVSLVPFVPARGVVGRFMGYSARYLVGVGVSQNMPLNGILWLLTGIFGDGVRYPFSALPVASFSPICHALRPLSAAVSWRSCGRFPAVSWRKRRVCVLSCLGSFSAFHVMGRMASRTGCRAGWMAPAGRLACLYRFALPLPLGAGDYVRPAGVGSACCEGVGVSLRFPLISLLVVVSSHLRRHRLSLLASLPPCRSHPRSRAPCVSFLPAPCLMCVRSFPCVLVLFLIVLLPVLAISRAGRSLFACPCVVAFVLFALLSRLVSLAFACLPSGIVRPPFPSSSHAVARPAPSSCSCLIALSCSSCLPRLATSVSGERSGSFSLCLPLSPSCGRRLAGGGIASAVRVCCLAGRAGWRVVFGLWCRCLYIQFGCLFGYYCCCRKKANKKGFRR